MLVDDHHTRQGLEFLLSTVDDLVTDSGMVKP